jgi:2-polyprenyl-3-methyl-5-hydroxy-6-metoxy-1,4-benzoquinol methylase
MHQNGYQCTGIEQDADVRELAKKEFSLNILPPEDLYKFEEKQFDVITLWHVLEHVHDLSGYLTQIKKILKPDGLLVVALPNPVCADEAIYKKQWAGWDVPIHLWHFKPQNIKSLLNQYQFKMIDKRRLPFDPFYVSILSSQQRGDAMPMLTGGLNGLKSYLQCLSDIDKTTSLIYFFKQEQ